ncbi:S-layer homology domain-containing protein [Bacillus sp. HMF5848]|uniref:S-layer homology domain-containing protein n=1 Tax=Bacillus sp. HMF5848 TaxID=2495421 RepID=UPI000F765EBE|nr:S-layer homology domain-containing protein [Bacillus sp. HMF5848]RSK28995.1 S-layer homology domain-containing protein [Bacillus sp. HMF5848]
MKRVQKLIIGVLLVISSLCLYIPTLAQVHGEVESLIINTLGSSKAKMDKDHKWLVIPNYGKYTVANAETMTITGRYEVLNATDFEIENDTLYLLKNRVIHTVNLTTDRESILPLPEQAMLASGFTIYNNTVYLVNADSIQIWDTTTDSIQAFSISTKDSDRIQYSDIEVDLDNKEAYIYSNSFFDALKIKKVNLTTETVDKKYMTEKDDNLSGSDKIHLSSSYIVYGDIIFTKDLEPVAFDIPKSSATFIDDSYVYTRVSKLALPSLAWVEDLPYSKPNDPTSAIDFVEITEDGTMFLIQNEVGTLTFFKMKQPAALQTKKQFYDVYMYEDEIMYLYRRGIINGYNSHTFGPEDSITRLQAVQMILRELGQPNTAAPNPNFTDVTETDYGYSDIAKAVELGIVDGKPDGSFDRFGLLTRGQMAKILANAYELKGDGTVPFIDVSKDVDDAFTYIDALETNQITTGFDDNSYRPYDYISRQHFAVFLYRYLIDNRSHTDTVVESATIRAENNSFHFTFSDSMKLVELIEVKGEKDQVLLLATAYAGLQEGEDFKTSFTIPYRDSLDLPLISGATYSIKYRGTLADGTMSIFTQEVIAK